MKYLKKFNTVTEYEVAESGLILPNVSLVTENNTVHYNPYVDPYAGHDYVDLGLPSGTKWATMNIGATSETDYGNYYQYGKGADQYAATSGQSDYSGTENPLAASADTATQVWGGSWHMPTYVQCQELIINTTYQWVTDFNGSGINGGKFTSKTDSSKYVFFIASGLWNNGSQKNMGKYGYFWNSSPNTSNYAFFFIFYDGSKNIQSTGNRNLGFPIRPVVG